MERMNPTDKAWRPRRALAVTFFALFGALYISASAGAADALSCSENCDRKASDCLDACEAKFKDDKPRVECKLQCASERQKCEANCPAPAPAPAPSP
jgi:hypothetical protein